jgi:transposase-like protein
LDSLADFFAEDRLQRCIVHSHRNVLSLAPKEEIREVAAMIKTTHARECHEEACAKAGAVAEKPEGVKLSKAAQLVREGAVETLAYCRRPALPCRKTVALVVRQ